MKQLLSDHIFSHTLRYENHRLICGTTAQDRMEIGGFLGAAVLGALLLGPNLLLNGSTKPDMQRLFVNNCWRSTGLIRKTSMPWSIS